MIHVRLAEEPEAFNQAVRIPGLRAIAEMVGEGSPRRGRPRKKIADHREEVSPDQFPAYWTESLNDLMSLYHRVCAYSCFFIHEITGARSVDHFAAKSRLWHRVYEWNNYRLACALMNSRKKDFNDVLDPVQIDDGWFQLKLVGFQVLPASTQHPFTQDVIQQTIDRLKLNDSHFRNARAEDAEAYWNGDISLNRPILESPFVAMELHRQGRLNSGNVYSRG